jgi:hypothetical protein
MRRETASVSRFRITLTRDSTRLPYLEDILVFGIVGGVSIAGHEGVPGAVEHVATLLGQPRDVAQRLQAAPRPGGLLGVDNATPPAA